MRRATTPLILIAALFVLAGGYDVVRLGFPVNAAVSLILALALVLTTRWRRGLTPLIVAGAIVFEAASSAALIISRNGTLFGWTERIWTLGANQSIALEAGALVNLLLVMAIAMVGRRRLRPALQVR
jgi:hypothetical protein